MCLFSVFWDFLEYPWVKTKVSPLGKKAKILYVLDLMVTLHSHISSESISFLK
jgi:hypothetical protein